MLLPFDYPPCSLFRNLFMTWRLYIPCEIYWSERPDAYLNKLQYLSLMLGYCLPYTIFIAWFLRLITPGEALLLWKTSTFLQYPHEYKQLHSIHLNSMKLDIQDSPFSYVKVFHKPVFSSSQTMSKTTAVICFPHSFPGRTKLPVLMLLPIVLPVELILSKCQGKFLC